MKGSEEPVKRMADLLKSGATMLFKHCPQCNSPLFRIRDEVWCSRCNKRVIIVKEGEEQTVTALMILAEVEKTILRKLQGINRRLKKEEEPTKLMELGNQLSTWLEVLKRLRELRKA